MGDILSQLLVAVASSVLTVGGSFLLVMWHDIRKEKITRINYINSCIVITNHIFEMIDGLNKEIFYNLYQEYKKERAEMKRQIEVNQSVDVGIVRETMIKCLTFPYMDSELLRRLCIDDIGIDGNRLGLQLI